MKRYCAINTYLAEDPSIFTFSIHGRNNFPLRKEQSDLDIALEDGATDTTYLTVLYKALPGIFKLAKPDLAIYLAGADPYAGDRFGRIAISKDGLAERDRIILRTCHERRIPVAVTMAGGYARNIQATVDIHIRTVRAAFQAARGDYIPEVPQFTANQSKKVLTALPQRG